MLKDQIDRIILDADDTLWENNIFYVEAERNIVNLIEEAGFSRKEISRRFDEAERHVVEKYGYGSKNFILILEELYRYYLRDKYSKEREERFQEIVKRFQEHPNRTPLLFPEVKETLKELGKRYHLYILTKGNYEEQLNKITLSGLLDLVDDYFIAEEKNDAYYRKILEQREWKAKRCCMVGNSPKSDINPALRLGMYAVYIPYEHTWKMDNETLQNPDDHLITLQKFNELIDIL